MAIDDCMPYLNARFQNIGQCNRMNDRLNSIYWKQRYQSFAYKQMNIYEKELGWIFWTWKLSNYAETNELPSAYYWSLSLAINNGYIDLFDRDSIEKSCNYDPPYPEGQISLHGFPNPGEVRMGRLHVFQNKASSYRICIPFLVTTNVSPSAAILSISAKHFDLNSEA